MMSALEMHPKGRLDVLQFLVRQNWLVYIRIQLIYEVITEGTKNQYRFHSRHDLLPFSRGRGLVVNVFAGIVAELI